MYLNEADKQSWVSRGSGAQLSELTDTSASDRGTVCKHHYNQPELCDPRINSVKTREIKLNRLIKFLTNVMDEIDQRITIYRNTT